MLLATVCLSCRFGFDPSDPNTPLRLEPRQLNGAPNYGSTQEHVLRLLNTGLEPTQIGVAEVSANLALVHSTCGTELAPSDTCTFRIRFTSPGEGTFEEWLSLSTNTGPPVLFVLQATGSATTTVVAPIYPNNAAWNDYIKNANASANVFEQDDVSCTSTDGPGYASCIHGGEKRQAIISEESSCDGLTARDTLDAFDWTCDQTTGQVRWRSIGLKSTSRVGQLLDGATGAWRANQLVVSRGDVRIAASTPQLWWTNPVIDLKTVTDPEPATKAIELRTQGAIYLVATDLETVHGYDIDVDRVSIIVLDGATLSYSDTGDATANCGASLCLVDVYLNGFAWFEGRFAGDNLARVDQVLSAEATNFVVYRHVEALAASGWGIDLRNVRNSHVADIHTHDNPGLGLRLHWTSNAVTMERVLAEGNGGDGIVVDNVQSSRLSDITALRNGGHGIYIGSNSSNWVQGVRAIDNQRNGLVLRAHDHVQTVYTANNGESGVNLRFFDGSLTHAISSNNGEDGFEASSALTGSFLAALTASNNARNGLFINNAQNSVIMGLVAINNGTNGLRLRTNSNGHRLFGTTLAHNESEELWTDSNNNEFQGLRLSSATDCTITGLGNNVENNGSCRYVGGAPLPTVDTTNSIVGKLTSDATNATSLMNGAARFDHVTIDWLHFDNPHRGWGLDGGTFPDQNHRGRCVAGQMCRIWDWSLVASDMQLRDRFSPPNGDTVARFLWNASSLAECSQLGGTWNTPTAGDCSGWWLLNAIEVLGDGQGNDNGLCESAETCWYTPNVGAYQGHGDVELLPFRDGAIANVTLRQWVNNGR